MDIRVLLVIAVFTVLFYHLFLEVTIYPAGGQTTDSPYDMPFYAELIESWGTSLPREDWSKLDEKRKELEEAYTRIIAADPVLADAKITNYQEFSKTRETFFDKDTLTDEEKKIDQELSRLVFEDSKGSKLFFEIQVLDRLDEYKNLLNKNKRLIGWVKIDDTYIDYPVLQTVNNDYYLNHNFDQEEDKNGSIFLDKDCSIYPRSTNLILYGHHMRSGRMFGQLNKYSSEKFYKEHKYIQFDTIYEKGTYEVMYVFRSKIYEESEIVFKYYQFTDAVSETEFESNMMQMADMSLYDTGVSAEYGDELLTLSTCDYYTSDGRFVVVAKKIR